MSTRFTQDIVDDIIASPVEHLALNVTTLKVLRNYALAFLSLCGCWLTDERSNDSALSINSTISVTTETAGFVVELIAVYL